MKFPRQHPTQILLHEKYKGKYIIKRRGAGDFKEVKAYIYTYVRQ
jgi:hypothetical protein